jgi:hypothetical protein
VVDAAPVLSQYPVEHVSVKVLGLFQFSLAACASCAASERVLLGLQNERRSSLAQHKTVSIRIVGT